MSEELKKFIEKIKVVSDTDLLDEANTKQTVILPILQYLNWNTCDANEVRAEYLTILNKFFDFLEKGNVESGTSLKNAENALEGQKREKTITETLPKAWDKIISEPDQRLLDLLADTTEKICGYKPDNENLTEFLVSVGDSSLKLEKQLLSDYQTGRGEGILVCKDKRWGVYARGRNSPDGFWVLKGSTAILSETKTIPPSAKKNRDKLKKEGILEVAGNFYEFTSDYRFNSPSAAAGVVLARSANGKIEWKNSSEV